MSKKQQKKIRGGAGGRGVFFFLFFFFLFFVYMFSIKRGLLHTVSPQNAFFFFSNKMHLTPSPLFLKATEREELYAKGFANTKSCS